MTLRLAIIGVGDVAQRDYLPELGRLADRVEPVVTCSLGAERARDVASRFGIPRWTTSYAEAIGADDVDAVVNLTPIALHVDVTLAALAAGKHVYSEKPLSTSSIEAGAIAEEAKRRGCVVVAAPCVMVFPQVRRTQEILVDGELGPVFTARGHGQGGVPPWHGYLSDPSPYFAAAAGPLVDMAVYPLHALTGLLGPVREVTALSARTRDSFEIVDGERAGTSIPVEADDNWHLLVRFEDGALASVEANNCAGGAAGPELELRGERGALGISLLDPSQPVHVAVDGETRSEFVPHGRTDGPDHILGIEHLADCVDNGLEPVLSVAHARHVIEVLEAAARSTRERAAVAIDSDFRRDTVVVEGADRAR
ncbi:MAG: Gfo/Idh/MocA family protein [Gaiellaceae bacterium]